MLSVITQILIVTVYYLGVLLTDVLFVNSIQTDTLYIIPVIIGFIVLLEHYVAVSVAKRNLLVSKRLDTFLLLGDIIAGIAFALYVFFQCDMQTSNYRGIGIAIVLHCIMLAFRTMSLFKAQALEKKVHCIWSGAVIVHHICVVLFIEALCAVIAFWGEGKTNTMGLGWSMTGLVVTILLLAEHYLVLFLVDSIENNKRVIGILLTIVDFIVAILLLLFTCVFLPQLGSFTIGSILFFVAIQILILLSRFYWLHTIADIEWYPISKKSGSDLHEP